MTRHLVAAVAFAVAALLAVPAVRHWRERPPEPPPPPEPVRAAWAPPEGVEVGAGSDYVFGLALAPDGRRLVYPAAKDGLVTLWLHDLRSGETHALAGTEQGAAPFWSPDGARIGFFAEGRLRTVDLASGEVSSLADAPAPRGGTWNGNGDIVFAPAPGGGLMKRAADGSISAITSLESANGETSHTWPAFLGDRHFVFLATSTNGSQSGIWMASVEPGQPVPRIRLAGSHAQPLVAGGQLLLLNDQTLLRQAVDVEGRKLDGRPAVTAGGVGHGPLGQLLATAAADLLIYGAAHSSLRELRWVSRSGETSGRAADAVDAWDLRIAADGRRVAVTEIDPQLRTLDVFIREGTQPVARRLSPSTDVDESGVWSPDGLRVAWAGRRRSVMIRGAGAVLPEQTIATFDPPVQVWDWSKDGRLLLVGRRAAGTQDDLWLIAPREGATAEPYATAAFNQVFGVFSPDGRFIAYASDESGTFDIYIDTVPRADTRVRVTTAGGTEPRWSRDGSELFFRRGSEIHAVKLIRRGNNLDLGESKRLFDAGAPVRSYDVSPDGRFLLNLPAQARSHNPMTLIHHWHSNQR
jgi:Tol biopolymer transport system component